MENAPKGRPLKNPSDRRGETVKVLLTTDEKERAQAKAEAEGFTLSAWVRALVRRELGS